jgi:HEAT repeat protein
MHTRTAALLLAAAVALPARAAEPPALAAELTLKGAGFSTDGPALLDFFRKRMRADADPATVRALTRQLADRSAAVREKALAELVARGPAVVPLLRQATKDPDDAEVARRARQCLQLIEGVPPWPGTTYSSGYTGLNSPYLVSAAPYPGPAPAAPAGNGSDIPIAAARLVVLRNPPGAAEMLLAYLPHADNESVLEEVKNALAALALRDGKPEPALVRGLEDKVAVRRVVAAEVLCQAANAEPRAALRRLLRDPQPLVRLRLALALAGLKEAEAVAVLIALLTDLPPSECAAAEDYLLTLAGEHAPQVPLGNTDATRQKCRQTWAAWWDANDGPALLNEFRKRSLADPERNRAQALIKQLGDDTFAVREKATEDLKGMGPAIVPLLRQAANSPDLEVSQRAQKVLQAVEKDKLAPLAAVNARLVAFRKPAGAAEALLGYLPLADDETVAAEVRAALAAVAVRDGRPEPAVVRALEDAVPVRRAAAAEALCRAGALEQRPAVRRLLQDKDLAVRQQAGLALAGSGDREAVPVLIALLSELPPEMAFPVEEFLYRAAGERAPDVRPGPEAATRTRIRQAWETWWRENAPTMTEAQLASARLERQRQLGYTLVVSLDQGQVLELGPDGKPRWQLNGLQGPSDAQVLPNGRVLITEMHNGSVSERTLKNEVVWQKQVNLPMGAQRLPNGNTFIVMRNQLVEVDRAGKEVFTYPRPEGNILAAQKMRDGQIICLTSSMCIRLDSAGKELRSFRLVGPGRIHGMDVLPNGRVLVAQTWQNKVVEYDSTGRVSWEMAVTQPISAVRLPSGRLLVANQQWPPKVVEMDRTGKVVWETPLGSHPSRIKRR